MPGGNKPGRPNKGSGPHHNAVNPNNIMNTAFAMWSEGKTLEDVRAAFDGKTTYINYLRNVWVHLQTMENAEEEDRDDEIDWDAHERRDAMYVELLMACGGHPVIVMTKVGPVWINHEGKPWREHKPSDLLLARANKIKIEVKP